MNDPARARLAGLLMTCLLLAGCATAPRADVPAAPEHAAALALLDAGQPRQAAERLEAQAGTVRGALRSQWLADAAFAWHEAGDDARARGLLGQLQPRHLAGASAARHALLLAELALADRQPQQALQALSGNPQVLPPSLQTRWWLARGRALEAGGQAWAAASAYASADADLDDSDRRDNQHRIARLLATLDDASLASGAAALAAGDPLYNFAGRALLARGLALPRPFDRGTSALVDTSNRAPADADGYRPPARLAVLLPLSGPLATAAAPVRDGLLTGYYGEHRRRPSIDFYDTTGTPAGALAAYDRAVAAGADFVVGPLGRDEVGALFARGDALKVPVLALNRPTSGHAPPPGHADFSLAPEDDGQMAAEYLLGLEKRGAVILAGNDDNGRRAAAAFRERFTARGGQVLGTISLGAEVPMTLSAELAPWSAAEAVFLAVRGPQARALMPQLALAGLAGRTQVATSQLLLGTGKPEEDVVLDGIVFPDDGNGAGLAGLPALTELPSARGAAARLFAFGHDAWEISVYLDRLAGGQGLSGATGTLHLDGFGNVLRRPAWSTFSGGHHVPVNDGGH